MKSYDWEELSQTPGSAGVYAWYYRPEITRFDFDSVVQNIRERQHAEDKEGAEQALTRFLDRAIFRYFLEDPYEAILKGPLKPRYKGTVNHSPALSPALVTRILEEPERLATIKDVLESSAPEFASPMYIGMSDNLRIRLMRHKRLIERYRDLRQGVTTAPTEQVPSGDSDHSFAKQVASRQMTPTRLFVVARAISCEGSQYVDIENILNRIHYPLLGRN